MTEESKKIRDPSVGVGIFNKGTERELLKFVEEGLAKEGETSDKANTVMKLVDKFSVENHWMMHVGPEKGLQMQDFLKESVKKYKEAKANGEAVNDHFVIVELGSYCGYSTIAMAVSVLEEDSSLPFHIYSVDVKEEFIEVATGMAKAAGVGDKITFLHLQDPADNNTALTKLLTESAFGGTKIDFLFVDHYGAFYIPDLKQLQNSGMIQKGSYVAADNVLRKDTPYVEYIKELKEKGYVESQVMVGVVAYHIEGEKHYAGKDPLDGIELTVYIENPPKE